VHSGALGWVGMAVFATFYYTVPKLWKKQLYSVKLATFHFWLATIGIVLYVVAMWVSGITQGLMWRAFDDAGQLQYANFMDTVLQLMPFYWIRLLGGLMFLVGLLLMAWNLIKTATSGAPEAAAPVAQPAK
jgi:cytochrome c oxidase cbb3-type subunit 1